MTTPTVICGEVETRCICILEPHADGPHVCECGGSWEIVEPTGPDDNGFRIRAMPTAIVPRMGFKT